MSPIWLFVNPCLESFKTSCSTSFSSYLSHEGLALLKGLVLPDFTFFLEYNLAILIGPRIKHPGISKLSPTYPKTKVLQHFINLVLWPHSIINLKAHIIAWLDLINRLVLYLHTLYFLDKIRCAPYHMDLVAKFQGIAEINRSNPYVCKVSKYLPY